MADLANLVQSNYPMQISPVGQNTMQNLQAGAQIAGIASQNAQRAQEKSQEQLAMQRQQQLRDVYSRSVGADGNVDPDAMIRNLYSAGFGTEAQTALQQQSENAYRQAHANYMNGIEQTRAKMEQLQEVQKQASMVTNSIGAYKTSNPDLFQNPGAYEVPDLNNPPKTVEEFNALADKIQNGKALSPAQVGGYDAVYQNIPENLRAKILSPEQFREDPATAISKLDVLLGEGYDYHKATGDATQNLATVGKIGNQQQTIDEKTRHDIATENLGNYKAAHPTISAQINQLDPNEQAAIVKAAQEGRLDPDRLSTRTAKIIAGLEMKAPGTDWNAIAAQMKFEKSTGVMNTKALLNSVTPILDKLYTSGLDLQNTPLPGVNKVTNWVKEQVGQDKIVAFNNLRTDAVIEVQRALFQVGVVPEKTLFLQFHNLNSAQSPEQLKAAIDNIKYIIGTRKHALDVGPNPEAISNPNGAKTQQGPGNLPTPASRDEVMKMAPGTHFLWQGVEHVKQ